MKIIALVCAVLVAAILLVAPTAAAAPGNVGFGFNARGISGFPTGAATLTGGGAYNPTTGFVNSAGGFRCTSDVGQGPLIGCLAGEGVRWDTVNLLRSTTFKCTGAAAEPRCGFGGSRTRSGSRASCSHSDLIRTSPSNALRRCESLVRSRSVRGSR